MKMYEMQISYKELHNLNRSATQSYLPWSPNHTPTPLTAPNIQIRYTLLHNRAPCLVSEAVFLQNTLLNITVFSNFNCTVM